MSVSAGSVSDVFLIGIHYLFLLLLVLEESHVLSLA